MVAEACQDTGHVYTSYSGYGDITIQSNDCDAPIGTLITITDPWSNNHTDEIMVIGTIKTYTSGSEVYTVEMTDMFCGVETTWSDYTECWYTDDGNRYVKTGGLDSAIGNNWANAWKTNGYGFQNTPSGKDLYVEEGLYAGETLSNLNPPQTIKMYIQPSTHNENPCAVIVSDASIVSQFAIGSTGDVAHGVEGDTFIQTGTAISQNMVIYGIEFRAGSTGFYGTLKLKSFQDDGTNFVFINESNTVSVSCAANSTVDLVFSKGLPVQTNDLLAFYASGTDVTIKTPTGNLAYRSGDIVVSSPKSWWFTYATNIGIKIEGF